MQVLVEGGHLGNTASVKELVDPDYSGAMMTTHTATAEWKEHWFVLKDGFMYNFVDSEDLKPFDVIYMDDAVVELSVDKPLESPGAQGFTIATAGRSWVMCGRLLPWA